MIILKFSSTFPGNTGSFQLVNYILIKKVCTETEKDLAESSSNIDNIKGAENVRDALKNTRFGKRRSYAESNE